MKPIPKKGVLLKQIKAGIDVMDLPPTEWLLQLLHLVPWLGWCMYLSAAVEV